MLRFVTTNEGKVREAREYLGEVEQFDYDYTEIQSDDLAEIAAHGAREAFEAVAEQSSAGSQNGSCSGGGGDQPVIVDDTGLFVEALGGFPGPYSAYVQNTLGIERVWQLAEREENRRASFRGVVAYCNGETVETFEGSVRGRLVAPRGEAGFGYDPIFEHDGRTFAELSAAEKNAISHRGRALAKLADWLATDA